MAAQFDLEDAIAELARSGAPTDAMRSALQSLGDLQRQVGNADPIMLAGLRNEINASAATGRAIVQQSRASASSDKLDDLLAATTARATVQRLADELFEQKILDPYLKFDSKEEEEAYRKREADREALIREALAKGTPEGNAKAVTLTLEQLRDAGDHGANNSPHFDRLISSAEAAEQALQPSASNAKNASRSDNALAPKAEASELDDVMAALRDAGVNATDAAKEEFAHGLAVGKLQTTAREV